MLEIIFYFVIINSMNIFRTFEVFLAAPLSIIQHKPIRIVHVETNIFAQQLPIGLNVTENETEITVYNNPKIYNLLSCVVYKQKKRHENNKSEVHN